MSDVTVPSGKISVLTPDLIGKIAAGEVVERPASVVKELVENSIDAGSTRVEIVIKGGGRLLIRVQDDGEGMSREDAILAFQRHATSKIRTDQDLLSIQTLGFRGEALPSIAAVSKVRMVTASRGSRGVGTELLLGGGKLLKVQEAGIPEGTLIEVKELFFNTPARLKFLRSVSTEIGHISHLLHQQALAHPEISFRLSHETRLLMDLPSVPDRTQRIRQIYGDSLTQYLLLVQSEWAGIKIWGMITKPPHTKSTRAYQEVFVNRRAITSPFVLHAVYEAYDTALMKGQHPVILLFLEMDGRMVDVNVHPTKREVRFRDQRLVYDLIRECVKSGLEQTSRKDLYPSGFEEPTPRGERVQEALATYLKTRPDVVMPKEEILSGAQHAPRLEERTASPLAEVPVQVLPLGQVYRTYILASIQEDLWIIDQHAAHERVLYERFLESLRKSHAPTQRLLIPFVLELSVAQASLLKEAVDDLNQLGLEIESLGPRSLAVCSVPGFLEKADLQGLIVDLLEDWSDLAGVSSAEQRRKGFAATLACHGAIKANQELTLLERESLLKDIVQLSTETTCPHGRPLRVKFSRKDLDGMFRR